MNAAAEASETFPHLTLYPTKDASALAEGGPWGLAQLTRHVWEMDGKDFNEVADFEPRLCKRVTSHENASSHNSSAEWPRTLVVLYTSLVDPRFCGVMHGTRGHVRSTLYKHIDGGKGEMVLGEFDCPPEEVEVEKALLSLRRMFQTRLDCTVDVFELEKVVGDDSARL